jgi:phospholipase/carboxylesterase
VSLALDFERSDPDRATDGATVAVLLHGRGSDKHDLQGLRPLLPREWVLVTPQAPFPAAAWGYGSGRAWYRYLEADRVVEETLTESLERLDAFLGELASLLRFEPGRRILGGFSQGGTLGLSYALSRPGTVAAALNFSGFLPEHIRLDETGANPPATPLFWGHGTGDPAVPIALAKKGRDRLRRAGARLLARDYRIGHWIAEEEVRDAVALVEEEAPAHPR